MGSRKIPSDLSVELLLRMIRRLVQCQIEAEHIDSWLAQKPEIAWVGVASDGFADLIDG